MHLRKPFACADLFVHGETVWINLIDWCPFGTILQAELEKKPLPFGAVINPDHMSSFNCCCFYLYKHQGFQSDRWNDVHTLLLGPTNR